MASPTLSTFAKQVLPQRSPAVSQGLLMAERITAATLLAASAPLLGCVLAGVWLLSERPPLVAHRRVGLHGQPFWLLKVRTMWDRSALPGRLCGWVERLDDPPVPPVKQAHDPRVTSRFAVFCRRHSIDELPQLWHVVRGTMRLVGPRPMTPPELQEHYGAVAPEVLSVHPGLTGLWQVAGRNRLTYAQRKRLDLFLVRRCSWRLYGWVLLRTAKQVLTPKGAW